MQFPNGVNKSNLIKLGILGAAVYMLRNKGNNKPAISNDNNSPVVADNKTEENPQKSTTAFQMGKELAGKLLGKKM